MFFFFMIIYLAAEFLLAFFSTVITVFARIWNGQRKAVTEKKMLGDRVQVFLT